MVSSDIFVVEGLKCENKLWYNLLNNHIFNAKDCKLNITCHVNLRGFLFISD